MKGKVTKGLLRGEPVFRAEGRSPLTGKRRRFYGATKAEAEAVQKTWNKEEQDAEGDEPLNPAFDPETTVAKYVQHHLKQLDPEQTATTPIRPKTFRSTKDALLLHVLPFMVGPGPATIGERKMRDWHRRWLPALAEAKRATYARDSVRMMVGAAAHVLSRAVNDDLLRHHPLDLAARDRIKQALRPTAVERETAEVCRCFNPYPNADGTTDVQIFLGLARQRSALYRLFVVGFLTGLRLGELCGLKLDDDQWSVVGGKRVRRLRVERQLGQDQKSLRAPVPTSVKTDKGRRLVDVADAAAGIFDEIKAERNRLILERGWPKGTDWMFVTGNGTPYGERYIERRFQKLRERAWPKKRDTDPDPPQWDLTPHSMRHTFAVTHILDGCDVQWLKQQLGHSSIAMTLDVYGSWFQKQAEGQANRAASRLLGDNVGDRRG